MREAYIITSACRIDRQPVAKGHILHLDIEDPNEGEKIATLNRAGRIAKATPENVDAIKAELKKEAELDKRRTRVPDLQPA